jgi:cytoskeleton protein RodZ
MSASEQSFGSHEDSLRIGVSLREARERLGLSVDDVSHAIKIQSTAVRQMESGHFEKLGPVVFAKGFLRSYAKHVNLGKEWIDAELAQLALNEAPTLVPSRGERLERSSVGERGMLAASYLVGTAILVSAIFLVTQFDRIMAPHGSETPQVTESTIPQVPTVSSAQSTTTVLATPPAVAASSGAPSVLSAAPVGAEIAAMTLPAPAPVTAAVDFGLQSQAENTAVAAGMATLPSLPTDVQELELSLSGTAWVEISDSTGRRLEFNNLSSGVRKSYSGKAPFTLKIGNASKAALLAAGKPVDLAVFTNASVARLRLVESEGALLPVAIEPRAQ